MPEPTLDDRGVWALIVNYKGLAQTRGCIGQLAAAGLPTTRVLVVDNASRDASVWALAAELPSDNVLPQARNLGFAGGCNVGIRAALARGAEAVLLINPDVTIAPDCLGHLTARPDLASVCVAPEIFRQDRPSALWFGGAWRGRWPGTRSYRKAGQPCTKVDYLWACGMLVGRAVWFRVGLFDATYFMYFEDMDWCDRARRVGVEPAVVPEARLWHAGGQSSAEDTALVRRFHMSRSAARYHRRQSSAALAVHLALAGRRAAALAARGERGLLGAHLRGLCDGLAGRGG